MCKPISWLEFKDGNILYLTDEEIFNTKRGQGLQDYCENPVDLVGHGAVRWYYDVTGGTEREVNDFSVPNNFPEKIITDFKNCKMKRMILNIKPLTCILSEPALAEYEKIEGPALAEYEKIQGPTLAEYEKIKGPAWAEYEKIQGSALAEYEKIKGPAWAEYEKIKGSAWAEYRKIQGSALAEYEKIEGPAWAEYRKIAKNIFWQLFSNPENRIIEWR